MNKELVLFLWFLIFINANDKLTSHECKDKIDQKWKLSPLGAIQSVVNPDLCWNIGNEKYLDGLLLHLGSCDSPGTPQWSFIDGTIRCKVNCPVLMAGEEFGGDLPALTISPDREYLYITHYRKDRNQFWAVEGNNIRSTGISTHCIGNSALRANNSFCPVYHTISEEKYYDYSGPILTPDGIWHIWQDWQNWIHYTSPDLIRWTRSYSANFTYLTGAVGVTEAGIFSFYPAVNQGSIQSAVATDFYGMNSWFFRGNLIFPAPLTGPNFRDVLRPFLYQDAYYIGVGCNTNGQSGDVCMYQSTDEKLFTWNYVNRVFTTKSTLGQVSPDNVWVNISIGVSMIECPDLFPLGNKWMLVASLSVTNQWWIGHMQGNPPIFIAENVGLLDFGNYYGAKSGSDFANGPNSRRVMFSFNGYNQPLADPTCGSTMNLPRDVTLSANQKYPQTNPVPEITNIRIPGSHQSYLSISAGGDGDLLEPLVAFPNGSRLQITTVCTFTQAPFAGRIILRVLGSTDGSHYTDVGFDFYEMALFVNLKRCCLVQNNLEQRAPLLNASLDPPNKLNITVFIDGQQIEAFLNGQVALTAVVNPNIGDGLPNERTNNLINTIGDSLSCSSDFWNLMVLR